ncbi:hypothetical protein [Pseudomonas sp. Irchel s3a10]|uniref:hypothetical protein n=1 Tax=Pseudomonas sp. Irchel s3a10 TaxID=2009045 RepID=UPI000BA4CACD|nr:hypothetical protein [Pseudomonas sp. Irchel s3a10]
MEAAMWANLIASFAFVISIISAWFTWKAAQEAKIANRISVHNYQKNLYEAFFNAKNYLQTNGGRSEISGFSNLYMQIQTARLYIDDALADQLIGFYDACVSLSDLRVALAAAERYRVMLESHRLVGGELVMVDHYLVENANKKQEACMLDLDKAVDEALNKAALIDKVFVGKIRLS